MRAVSRFSMFWLVLSAAGLAADSLELQLRPDSIVDGVPQGFTFCW